jgi:hypothetical protein
MYYDDTILIFLLENLEIYSIDFKDENEHQKKLSLICENYEDKITFFTLDATAILDAEDRRLSHKMSPDEFTVSFIKSKYPESSISKLPILEKLKQLADASTLTLLIRHKALTRGGEYIELTFLLGSSRPQPAKVFFLSKRGLDISGMVWELLDYHGVNFRPYKNEDELVTESIRLIRKFIRKND